jgi:hypothetical protein
MSCAFAARRRRRLVGCARPAQLCEIRADRFHFRIAMNLCKHHQELLLKWKKDLRIREIDPRDLESEVA